jgi:nicotinate-nucleotide pyrophosphorylase (carboxylating)
MPDSRPRNPSPGFGPAERRNADVLIPLALAEDMTGAGDVTSLATIPTHATGAASLVARQAGVLAGMPIVQMLCDRFHLALEDAARDGCVVAPGQPIGRIAGGYASLLSVERTALNFLQRLSGIATLTARYVEAVGGTRARILDTRKTTPGWRYLEKYAVRCGGGLNHRFSLSDGILIKDNHLAFLAAEADPIAWAVAGSRRSTPPGTVVEVEVDGLDQLDRALACGADIVLLDNFAPGDLLEAVRRRNARAPGIRLEASGGVNLRTVAAIAATGVDRISVGALTHSAPALDIALDHERPGHA